MQGSTYRRLPITDSALKHSMSVNKVSSGQTKGVANIINHPCIQPKLKIGAVNDPQEKEADRVADKVVHMQSQPSVQRKCEECEEELQMKPKNSLAHTSAPGLSSIANSASLSLPDSTNRFMSNAIGSDFSNVRLHTDALADHVANNSWQGVIQRKCETCERDEDTDIQTKMEQGASAPAANNIKSSSGLTASNGTALPFATNKHMSDSIGFDFSAVRVHTDKNAKQLNQRLHSRAFTYGKDIYFNQDQYQPSNSQGTHLLAHELTHVVQQSRGGQLIQKQDGPPGETPLTSDVGAFWFRANENGRIEFVYGTPEMPALGERGAGFRCENGSCSPIISGEAGIDGLGDTYTIDEALALLNGDDPDVSIPTVGICAPAQRNALGICCPRNMIANGLNCEPLPPFVPTLPGVSGVPSPDGPLHSPQLGESSRPSASVFPLSGLVTFDNFGFNQHSIPPLADAQISDLALHISIISLTNTGSVLITGYADAVGEDEDNVQLGLRRANAVKDRLIAAGVPASAVITDSQGESGPAIHTDQAEPRNRRVQVFYIFSNLHVPLNLGSRFRLTPLNNFDGIEPGPF